MRALTDLGLTDSAGHWTGSARRLVQVGDLIDRGPDPLGTLDLMMRLQAEAQAAGGEVVCLLGNHELMALQAAEGDHAVRIQWTYNGAGAELAQWGARRGVAVDDGVLPYPEAFYTDFARDGAYGRWLDSLPVACRVGDYIAVHAGWTPDGPESLEAANAPAPRAQIHGLVWARRQPESEIAAACSQLGCRGLIAGHSVQPGVRTSLEGRLIQIDVGMWYYETWMALGLDDAGRPWALAEGREPALIEGDGLVPLNKQLPAQAAAPEPRYRAGDLVRIYLAPDGSYRHYFLVEGMTEFHGYPAYNGRNLVFAENRWASRPAVNPPFCERVDRFGCPGERSEVPADLLE